MSKTTQSVEFTAVFVGVRWKSPDSNYLIGMAKADSATVTVCGNAPQGALIPEVEYRFLGNWEEHAKFGKQFKFEAAVQIAPHSRTGVAGYLQKYAPGIGYQLSMRLFDLYETNAVKVLRTDPERAAAECKGLSLSVAKAASAQLASLVKLEEARIALGQIFAGLRIPSSVVESAIAKWKDAAPDVIRRDPFRLLTAGIRAVGFARCDAIREKLGITGDKLKRQTICLWHVCSEDSNGSTWIKVCHATERLKGYVALEKLEPDRAIELGIRARWLATHHDGEELWLARADAADAEGRLFEEIQRIGGLTDGNDTNAVGEGPESAEFIPCNPESERTNSECCAEVRQ